MTRDCRVLESFKIMDYSLLVAVHNIDQAEEEREEAPDMPPGGIPARNHKGENLFLFVGIIDILQSYTLIKKLEHHFKALLHDRDSVSVHRPDRCAERFLMFMSQKTFKENKKDKFN